MSISKWLASPLLTVLVVASQPAIGADATYGHVSFPSGCAPRVEPALDAAIAKLHAFEARPSDFAPIIRADPGCALAGWGAAMSARGNPIAGPIDDASFRVGRHWLDAALAASEATPTVRALVQALDVYYRPFSGGHPARTAAYEAAMERVEAANPADPDVAAFTGLAMLEAVDLRDTTYARQRKAGALLATAWAAHPDNPGLPHYLIHAYDYPALAAGAVQAAEAYPALAPASGHAQHMPAHIWTMLGEWQKSIRANEHSGLVFAPGTAHTTTAADTVYAHAFDFIAYARLQLGQDAQVARDIDALGAGTPAVVRARYALERDDWTRAADLALPKTGAFDTAVIRFARALGAARMGRTPQAAAELAALRAVRPAVVADEGTYWGGLVDIYVEAADAWAKEASGAHDAARLAMILAADHDDGLQKHILLENKLLPMRELLGDLMLAQNRPADARAAYEQSLHVAPRRYRSLLGLARADKAGGDLAAAHAAYRAVLDLTRDADTTRVGVTEARALE